MQLTGDEILSMGRKKLVIIGTLSALLSACAGDRPDNLGARNGQLARCPSSPNCVASQAGDEDHRIAALVCRSDPDADFSRLAMLLKNRTDTQVVEESDSYLRVEFHTIFFVDDGEFFLDRKGKVIHLRSASRIGYSDLGKNRCRMEEIRRDFLKRSE